MIIAVIYNYHINNKPLRGLRVTLSHSKNKTTVVVMHIHLLDVNSLTTLSDFTYDFNDLENRINVPPRRNTRVSHVTTRV